MTSRALSSDVLVIGYGSLMSGLGLEPFGHLHVRGAGRVALLNARRGFGKISQHGDRFAMVLEADYTHQPIEARILASDAPPSEGPEGLLLLVQPSDLARLSDREGYSSGALQRLREDARLARQDLAEYLWSLFVAAELNLTAFRQRLFKLVGYTSPHSLPHPVRLDDERVAITFLAPGREGSGSERIVPVRVRTGTTTLMTIPEAWHRKPNRTQLAYFLACLLGGVHGINIQDMLEPLAEERGLSQRIRGALADELRHEVARFLESTSLDTTSYWQAFGPPTQALRRGGLEEFLKGLRPA
ncbi:MAG: hypothetical protein ACHQ4J_13730 [Candidatus Binatia bacterium]